MFASIGPDGKINVIHANRVQVHWLNYSHQPSNSEVGWMEETTHPNNAMVTVWGWELRVRYLPFFEQEMKNVIPFSSHQTVWC
jgi:hypothetical protein